MPRTRRRNPDAAQSPTAELTDPGASLQLPSLRTALWLYLLVMICTAGIITGFQEFVDPLFLRFVAALFVAAGFSAVALVIGRTQLAAVFGRRPAVVNLILSFVTGLVIWIPVMWLTFGLSLFLSMRVGTIRPLPPTQATDIAQALQVGLVIPLCQGLLFWAFIESAAGRASRRWGPLLVAFLYAIYGVFNLDPGGLSSIIGLLPVGLLGAFIVSSSGSAWYGIVLAAGYGLSTMLLPPPRLMLFIGIIQFSNPFSVGWLLVAGISLLVVLILFQVIRLRASGGFTEPTYRTPGRFWWAPLLLSGLIVLLLLFGEISVRLTLGRYITAPPAITNSSGSNVAPPVPVPVTGPTPTSGAAR